jgi:hypothetical protein
MRMARYRKTILNLSASITMKMAPPPSHGACSGCIHVSVPAGSIIRKTAVHVGLTANLRLPGGGMPQTTNRTKWPVNGGALSIQPGWFPGHSSAYIYVNIGINEPGHQAPRNMSHPVHPVMSIVGPSNDEYGGQFCLPQIGMPPHLDLKVGDNITIQVIETAQHGAALYSVSSPHDHEVYASTNIFQVRRRYSRRARRS